MDKYRTVRASLFDEYGPLLNEQADEGYCVIQCGHDQGAGWWALMVYSPAMFVPLESEEGWPDGVPLAGTLTLPPPDNGTYPLPSSKEWVDG